MNLSTKFLYMQIFFLEETLHPTLKLYFFFVYKKNKKKQASDGLIVNSKKKELKV